MIINHNLAALDTWRQLGVNETNLNDSLAKLSSGLRINSAADDPAGLAISEKMRGQINGLDQAQRNAQDGISMIQTAEGALNETHSILQTMRELAVQASNDTLTDDDRLKIQSEMDQLSQEVTRISNTTQFNTRDLLNGALTAGNLGEVTLQIGANEGQSLQFGVGAMDAYTLGVAAKVRDTATVASGATGITGVSLPVSSTLAAGTIAITSTANTTATAGALAGSVANPSLTTAGALHLTVDGANYTVNLGGSAAVTGAAANPTLGSAGTLGLTVDGNSYTVNLAGGTAGAITGTAANPSISSNTNESLGLQVDGGAAFTVTFSNGESLASVVAQINTAAGATIASADGTGHIVLTSTTTGASSSITVTAGSGANALSDLGLTAGATNSGLDETTAQIESDINTALSGKAGASLNGSGDLVITSASSGSSSSVTITGGTAMTALGFTSGQAGTLTAQSDTQIVAAINSALGTAGTASINASNQIVITSASTGASSSVAIGSGSDSGVLSALGFTSGASNTGAASGTTTVTATQGSTTDTVTVDSGAAVIDFTGNFSGLSLTKDPTATSVSGNITIAQTTSSAATFANGDVAEEATVAGGIDVSTQTAANSAITAINDAIDEVSDERAKFGAMQDRLQHTINNLGTASQNLTAAESRIRDVDMAKEIMNFTKEQILVQAGTSMLAQAKALPQSVLQLLR